MKRLLWSTLAAAAIALAGCASSGCKATSTGPVHPTDDQINSAPGGEATKDYPYTPWWVEWGLTP